jgi:hypothetical protein
VRAATACCKHRAGPARETTHEASRPDRATSNVPHRFPHARHSTRWRPNSRAAIRGRKPHSRRAIAEPAEVEVAEFGQLGGTVVNLLYQGLVKALADAALVVVAQAPPPPIRRAKPMWTSPSSLDLPQSLVWEPPPPNANVAAAAG